MASFPTKPSCHSLLLLILVLLSFTQVIAAGRQVSALADKKQIEGDEGTVLIPGIGRYMYGSDPQLPSFGDLDHSGPAAANGQYIPGFDDTFFPNPGFEIPSPYYGGRNP